MSNQLAPVKDKLTQSASMPKKASNTEHSKQEQQAFKLFKENSKTITSLLTELKQGKIDSKGEKQLISLMNTVMTPTILS